MWLSLTELHQLLAEQVSFLQFSVISASVTPLISSKQYSYIIHQQLLQYKTPETNKYP